MADEKTPEKLQEELLLKQIQETQEHCCKRCGYDNRKTKLDIDPELVKTYFARALAQTPFTKQYKLWNGQLLVEFEETNGELEELLQAWLQRKDLQLCHVFDCQVTATLKRVTMIGENNVTKIMYESTLDERKKALQEMKTPEALKKLQTGVMQVLRNTMTTFTSLCQTLTVAAQDENFWEGAGLN